jgi:hypothetical protein
MESKKINQLATELAPDLSDLTIIGDPTTGISKKITLSQMASLFTGTVEEYANLAAFPLVGVADTIYIALDTNVIYRYDTSLSAYVILSPNIINSLVFSDANGFDGTITLVGSVATLSITTALTLGSVPFIGASGALTQDNSNLFFDDTNNRLGIATALPTTPLDVFGSGIIGRLNATSTNNAYLGFASNGTNKWSAGNVQSDHRFRIFSEANSAELITILQTGEFGIGIANPLTKLHIDGGATALIANLDANVSVAKSVSFRSDNSSRINLEVSGTESGSNAGADFFLRTFTDAGSLLETPLSIVRSTGVTTIKSLTLTNALSVGNGGTGATSFTSGSILFSNGTLITQDNTNLFWDNTNDRLGIGLNTPAKPLGVYAPDATGNIILTRASTAETLTIGTYYITAVGNDLQIQSGTSNILQLNPSGGNVVIAGSTAYNKFTITGSTARMDLNDGGGASRKALLIEPLGYNSNTYARIESYNYGTATGGNLAINTTGGNVGIGTASNIFGKLSVEAAGNHITMRAPAATAGKYWALDVSSANQFYVINNAGTQFFTMTDAGNFGIGASSPGIFANYTTASIGGGNSAGGILQFQTTSGTDAAHIRADRSGATLNTFTIETRTSAPMIFGTNATTRMTILSGGNIEINNSLSVGTTIGSNVRLTVQGGDSTASNYAIDVKNSTTTMFFVRNDGYMYTGLSANSPYNIAQSGRTCILASNGSVGYLSSTRESKANIESITNADFINQLNPVQFNYRKKDEDTNQYTDEYYDNITYGFIADEVEKVNKELVFYNSDNTTLAGVDYNSIIAILTKAVQELKAEVEILKAK